MTRQKVKIGPRIPKTRGLALIQRTFDDKDVDNLIEHFRDKDRRKEFFKEYKEIDTFRNLATVVGSLLDTARYLTAQPRLIHRNPI